MNSRVHCCYCCNFALENNQLIFIITSMGGIRSAKKRILDFAPNFYSGVASVLTPGERNRQLHKVVKSMRQDDGLYEDWRTVGKDLRMAMNKFKAGATWQRR